MTYTRRRSSTALPVILSLLAASTAVAQTAPARPAIIASAGIAGQSTTNVGIIFPGVVASVAAEFPAIARFRLRADASVMGFLAGAAALSSCAPSSLCDNQRTAGGLYTASGSIVIQPFRSGPYAVAGVGVYSAPHTSESGSVTSRGASAGIGWVLPGGTTMLEMRYHRVARDLGLMRSVTPLTFGVRF